MKILFLLLVLLLSGCASPWYNREPYYVIEIYYPKTSHSFLMGVKIPTRDLEYYQNKKSDEYGEWGKVTGPYAPINKPNIYYAAKLNNKIVYLNKLDGELLEIYGGRNELVKDSTGTWSNLKGPFYTNKRINYYEFKD